MNLSRRVSLSERLSGIVHVGISITYRDGRVETVAATDQLVWDLDPLQYELHEGPCLDAIEKSDIVEGDDLVTQEARWPRFVPPAAALGLRAQMGAVEIVQQNNENHQLPPASPSAASPGAPATESRP
jgi:hypothetical protein